MGRRVRTLGLQLRHWQQLSKPALVALSHLKVDNCAVPDMEQPPQVRYKKIGDALKRSGRKIVLNMCEWGLSKCCSSLRVFVRSLTEASADNPAEWGPWAGATSWRVSGDIKWGQYGNFFQSMQWEIVSAAPPLRLLSEASKKRPRRERPTSSQTWRARALSMTRTSFRLGSDRVAMPGLARNICSGHWRRLR